MKTLKEIVKHKRVEVENHKQLYPIRLLESSLYFPSQPVSMKKYLLREDKSGIIAEIKKKSPSAGVINKYIDIEKTSIGYMQAGASALSVLTDKEFFGGCNEDLITARKFNFCPILRKDFVIEEYQIIEAKAVGADTVLLIAAILSPDEIKKFTFLAQSLGMEVLLELHGEEELSKLIDQIDIIGVNNRDLNTMRIDIEHSIRMSTIIPSGKIKISESGIDSAETIIRLKNYGFDGFLIGSQFMKQSVPYNACKEMIVKLRQLQNEKQECKVEN